MKSRLLIIIGIVLTGVFGFGVFFTQNLVNVSEPLPESSFSSEIPLYDGMSAPDNLPLYDGMLILLRLIQMDDYIVTSIQ